MVVAVAVEPLVGLVDEGEARLGGPAADLFASRGVVAPAGPPADVLAADRGQAGGRLLGEGAVEFSTIDLLDRQVEVAARAERPSEVRQDEGPFLWRHVLHRTHAHCGVERLLASKFLEADLMEACAR